MERDVSGKFGISVYCIISIYKQMYIKYIIIIIIIVIVRRRIVINI